MTNESILPVAAWAQPADHVIARPNDGPDKLLL